MKLLIIIIFLTCAFEVNAQVNILPQNQPNTMLLYRGGIGGIIQMNIPNDTAYIFHDLNTTAIGFKEGNMYYHLPNNIGWQIMVNPISTIFGSQTASGTGSISTFAFPHHLSSVPTYANAVAKTSDAGSINYIDADETNIYIHYTVSPPAGTNNLRWYIAIRP